MKKQLLSLGCLLLLAGCTAPQQVNSTANDNKVVTQVSDIQWTDIQAPTSVNFPLLASSQRLKSGKIDSHVAALSLSNNGLPIKVTISSKIEELKVFVPSLSVYDQDFNLLANYSSDQFDYDRNDFIRGEQFFGEVSIHAPMTVSKFYLVVYTTPQDLKETTTLIHPAKAMAIAKRNLPPAIDDPIAMHLATGEVTVSVTERQALSLWDDNKSASAPVIPRTEQQAEKPVSQKVNRQVDLSPQSESVTFYHEAIKKAVKNNDIPKALALLEEAKALNIEKAQEVFVEAVNALKK